MPNLTLIRASLCAAAFSCSLAPGDEPAEFFESKVRPLLVEHCQECHNADDQQGGVRLDIRSGVFGKIGKASVVAPNEPDASRLIAVIKYDDNDIQMPPEGALSEEHTATLTKWIADGAYWPKDEHVEETSDPYPRREDGSIDFEAAANAHWAFQPIEAVEPPVVNGATTQSPIDQFVVSRLSDEGLSQSAIADRATLIRRMSFDLIGLPPTYDEVQAFVGDNDPNAIGKVIERLLANPHFGERWARHWLDVARYADTSGYRTGGQTTEYPNAYTYRDWVIQAFNEDLPYDQFVTAQIAADHRWPDDPHRQAALGLLTVGPLFTDNRQEQINDQIDVVSRGFMGMTMTCARCHDHKFDPVPMSDYYALYGVFESTQRVNNGTEIPVSLVTDGIEEFRAELAKREEAYRNKLVELRQKVQEESRNQLADYLVTAVVDAGLIPKERRPTPEPKLRDRFIRGWKDMLARQRKHRVVRVLWELAGRRDEADFRSAVINWATPLKENPKPSEFAPEYIDLLVASPPDSLESAVRQLAEQMTAGTAPFTELFDIQPAPTAYSAEDIRQTADRDYGNQIREAKTHVDKVWVTHPHAPPRAMTVVDSNPHDVQIFIRGNSGRRGDVAPRRFPQVLASASAERFTNGSGRSELADGIVDPKNPLTARVIVNRVWMHYFGRGLVVTPSDFGTQGELPSHPDLLDYLASELIDHDWSLKWLHREILRSATYQQSSADRPDCRSVDPENALLWRQNRRRLEWEPMRDSMLAVAEMLSDEVGGKAVPLGDLSRRSIYLKVDRNNPPELTRTFDVPDTEQSAPERSETTVPQQALFLMNNGSLQKIAESMASKVNDGTEHDRAVELFRRVLSRDPTESEQELIASLLKEDAAAACKVLLMSNEFVFVD